MTTRAAVVLGIGWSNFLVGQVLLHIHRWRGMPSVGVPSTGVMWDGLLHAVVLVVALTWVYRLLRDEQPVMQQTNTAFVGGLIVGCGVNNLVLAMIDLVLGAARVHSLPFSIPLGLWQFLMITGFGLVAFGYALGRTRASSPPPPKVRRRAIQLDD